MTSATALRTSAIVDARAYELALTRATDHFGADHVDHRVGRSSLSADECKVCGMNLDADDDSDDEPTTGAGGLVVHK